MEKIIWKRIFAYVIDLVIVSLLISLLSYVPFLNIKMDDYSAYQKEITSLSEQKKENKITEEEYKLKTIELTYKMDKIGISYTILSVTCLVGYFVLLQYFLKGQTIGKKLFKIKVRGINNRKATILDYLIRLLIINNVFSTVISLICVLFLSKTYYYYISTGIQSIGTLAIYITIILVFWRADHRGLHDILARTEVIAMEVEGKNIKQEKIKNSTKIKDNRVVEASYKEK